MNRIICQIGFPGGPRHIITTEPISPVLREDPLGKIHLSGKLVGRPRCSQPRYTSRLRFLCQEFLREPSGTRYHTMTWKSRLLFGALGMINTIKDYDSFVFALSMWKQDAKDDIPLTPPEDEWRAQIELQKRRWSALYVRREPGMDKTCPEFMTHNPPSSSDFSLPWLPFWAWSDVRSLLDCLQP